MNKIGLISGDGNLPLHIGKILIKHNFDVTFFLLNSVKDKRIYENEKSISINIISVKKIINTLKKNNIQKIIFAGSINRPSIKDLGFDIETIKLAKHLLLEKKGDNNLLISIKKYMKTKGFSFFNWKKYCPDLFSNEKNLSKIYPTKNAIKNLSKAKSVYNSFKKMDVGQSMVVQNQLILGLEAIEGTDSLLERCANYKRSGDKGILLKFSKKNQSNLIDIPLIGLQTLHNLKKYNYEGIFLEKNKCLILDKENVIKYANENKIFISNIDLN